MDEEIPLSKKQSNVFSTDLTPRDDLLLSILSILRILIAESFVASVLLHTINGKVSNFGFSIKHFIQAAREFNSLYLVKGKTSDAALYGPSNINFKLLLLTTVILTATFSFEAVLLFLSSLRFHLVSTKIASLSIVLAVYPEWTSVRRASDISFFFRRPCRYLKFAGGGIDMGETRVVPCVTSNADEATAENFIETDEEFPVTIISDVHGYGKEKLL